MKKSTYGLNDAPRRWWQVVDMALLSYGLVPTRADRCTYTFCMATRCHLRTHPCPRSLRPFGELLIRRFSELTL